MEIPQPHKALGEGEPFKPGIAKVSKSPVCENKNKAKEEQSRRGSEFQRGLLDFFFPSFSVHFFAPHLKVLVMVRVWWDTGG